MDTKKLRQKILDLAIRGKLVPQDPNDEPASVLLERIRAEKERLIKEGKIKRSKKSAKSSDTPHYENQQGGEANEVPFEVPEGWEWCRLIDVCHIFGRIGFRGYTKDDLVSYDGAITLSPSNIIDGQMNYENCTYISWDKYEESPEIQISNGDILLVKTGSSFGKCAYVYNLPQKATINPQFVVLKHILCNPHFLTYILQSGYARMNYDEFVLGTAIPTFTQVVLGNMYIPLPSIQEQERIVAAIKQWFTLIDTLESAKEDLQTSITQAKSKILDLAIHGKLVPQDTNDEPAIELLKRINPKFTPCDNADCPFDIPKNWEWCKLPAVCDSIFAGGDKPTIYSKEQTDNCKIPIYSNGIENDGLYGYTNIAVVNKPSITISARGTIGYTCIRNSPFVPIIRLITIVPNQELVNIFFLRFTIGLSVMPSEGSSIPQLTVPSVKLSVIPLPPYNEQLRIVAKIEELFAVLDEIKKSLEA